MFNNSGKLVKNSVKLRSFFSLAGLSFGDSLSDLYRLFGQPDRVSDDPESALVVVQYFIESEEDLGLYVCYDRADGLIRVASVSTEYALFKIREKGIIDENLFLFFGRSWAVIRSEFGEPSDSHSDNFEYKIYRDKYSEQTDDYAGQVTFVCYDHNDYKCTDISVHWFLDS